MTRVDQVAIVARQVLDAIFRRFDEDIRLVTGRAEHTLNPEDFVADCIAVPKRGEDLVHANHARLRSPASAGSRLGPAGSRAMTSLADGRFLRRRSNQPGRGSIVVVSGVFFNCSNTSRYLRSI